MSGSGRKRMGGTDHRYYMITHCPDTTETGLPMKRTYVRATWDGHSSQRHDRLLLEQWCEDRFGSRTDYVQGVAPVPAWEIWDSDEDKWREAHPIKWGGYATETKRIALSLGVKTGLDDSPIKVIFEQLSEETPPSSNQQICPKCGHIL